MVVCLENAPTGRVLPLIAGLSEGRVFVAPLGVDPRAEPPTATSAAKWYLPMIDVHELNVIGAEHRTHHKRSSAGAAGEGVWCGERMLCSSMPGLFAVPISRDEQSGGKAPTLLQQR